MISQPIAQDNHFDLISLDWESNDTVINKVSPLDKTGRLAARSNIEHFENILKSIAGDGGNEADQINADGLVEHFVGGAYVRELLIPKDKFIVSRIWNKVRMWIIVSGEVTFSTEMGVQRVKAPYTKIVPHGSKVALYTHEDTLWFAITGAESTDSESVKDEVTADDYSECDYPWDKIEHTGEKK
jgi:hypothetical protein